VSPSNIPRGCTFKGRKKREREKGGKKERRKEGKKKKKEKGGREEGRKEGKNKRKNKIL
jgi:hypothetical protein